MNEVMSFKDLYYYYESRGKNAAILEQVNYTFKKGKLYTTLWPSSSGKTTAL